MMIKSLLREALKACSLHLAVRLGGAGVTTGGGGGGPNGGARFNMSRFLM